MRSLFRSFEHFGVDYLLISGQASILYGAATFSEDVDLWIRPTGANARRVLGALAARRARVHKLTPPLEPRFLRRGHGGKARPAGSWYRGIVERAAAAWDLGS